MRITYHLLLALASWSTAASEEEPSARSTNILDSAEKGRSAGMKLADTLTEMDSGLGHTKTVAARYPLPEPQCDSWVGLEVIFMAEITEVCPEGSTVTTTITECVETLTRSICATPTTNLPCYPCVMGTPAPSETVTVIWTSCSAATDKTITATIQPCSACSGTTFVGTVPGYTPGGPCVGCSPFTSISASSPPSTCSEDGSSGAGPLATTTTTSTSTSTVVGSACASTSSVLGNSGLSSSATTTHTTHTSTTAAPPVTAGGGRNGVGFAGVFVVWVVAGVLLGM